MKVLVPVQDNESGQQIVEYIAGNQWSANTVFQVFHVVNTSHLAPFADRALHDVAEDFLNQQRVAGLKIAKYVRDQLILLAPGATVLRETIDGCPKEKILAEAISWPADLIIMGAHRFSDTQRFLLGSVSMDIIKTAPCSVLVVKNRITTNSRVDLDSETANTAAV